MSEEGRKHIDPRLLALIDKAGQEEGICVQDLRPNDVVEIKTHNHIYTLKVLDPKEQKVEATSNGRHITKPTITYANGSSLTGTGTMMKMGWIAVGYRFLLGGLLLSTTQSISVNGVKMFPKEEQR